MNHPGCDGDTEAVRDRIIKQEGGIAMFRRSARHGPRDRRVLLEVEALPVADLDLDEPIVLS